MIIEQEITIQQALAWVEEQFRAKAIPATILREQVEERQDDLYTFIGIPIRVHEDMDAYDEAKLFSEIQGRWNFREPRPEKMLSLLPAGIPQGVW